MPPYQPINRLYTSQQIKALRQYFGYQKVSFVVNLPAVAEAYENILYVDLTANTISIKENGAWTTLGGGPTGWGILGNAGTVQATNFIGTTDAIGLSMRTNNAIRMTILSGGNVGVGTINPGNLFEVDPTTADISGMRLKRLNINTTVPTIGTDKVLAVDINGDVVLRNMGAGIVDFSVNANPNTGGTTFSPNTPTSVEHTYISTIDGSRWKYNGTTYVAFTQSNAAMWALEGNTVTANRRFGTISNFSLPFITNNVERMRITNTGDVAIGVSIANSKLDLNGALLMRTVAVASGSGTIGTAATTVDISSNIEINQTAVGNSRSLPSPTNNVGGRILNVINVGTAAFSMTANVTGLVKVIMPGSIAKFIYSTALSQWIFLGSSQPYCAKANVVIGEPSAAGVTYSNSYNIASISAGTVSGSTVEYTVTLTNAMPNINYSVLAIVESVGLTDNDGTVTVQIGSVKTTTTFKLRVRENTAVTQNINVYFEVRD